MYKIDRGGSVRVSSTSARLGVGLPVGTSFQIFAVTAGEISYVGREIIPKGQLSVTVGDRSFGSVGPKLWNSLPDVSSVSTV